MKKIPILILALQMAHAKAQLNVQNTNDIAKPVFSYGGYLQIKNINGAYNFEIFDQVTQRPTAFMLNNKQSAQDFLDLALKILTDKNTVDNFTFRNLQTIYTISWMDGKLYLFIVHDNGKSNMWELRKYILETVTL